MLDKDGREFLFVWFSNNFANFAPRKLIKAIWVL